MAPVAGPTQQLSPGHSSLANVTTSQYEQPHDFSSFSDHIPHSISDAVPPAQSDTYASYGNGSNSQYYVHPAQIYQNPGAPSTMLQYMPSSNVTPFVAPGDLPGRTSGFFVYVPSSYAPTVELIPKYSSLSPTWTSVPTSGVAVVPVIEGVRSADAAAAPVVNYGAARNNSGGMAVFASDPAAAGLDAWTAYRSYPTAAGYHHGQQVAPVMLLQQQPQPSIASVAPSIADLPAQSAGNPFINTTNMQHVWHGAFDQNFYSFLVQHGDLWELAPIKLSEESESIMGLPGVKTFNDSAKVRFLCKACGNPWTSMKGKVVFWIRLERSVGSKTPFVGIFGNGTVRFKLFGQRCQKCSSDKYENAMWYPEEVVKVIKNLFFRVGQTYYGFEAPVADSTRRPGRPRTQHNSSYCQACAEGICKENVR